MPVNRKFQIIHGTIITDYKDNFNREKDRITPQASSCFGRKKKVIR
jgi:hypothetical protein